MSESEFRAGDPFVSIPVDALVEESMDGSVLWPKVQHMAAVTLGTTEVVLTQTLVECFPEHHLGKHLLEECRFPAAQQTRYYLFQEAPDA